MNKTFRRSSKKIRIEIMLYTIVGAIILIFAPFWFKFLTLLCLLAICYLFIEYKKGGFFIMVSDESISWGVGDNTLKLISMDKVYRIDVVEREDDKVFFRLLDGNSIEIDSRWISFRKEFLLTLKQKRKQWNLE